MKSRLRGPVNPRGYDASRRRLASAARRQQVLVAARVLFTARGYAGTTMSEIAERAGVSIKTVEAMFGTKAALLKVIVDVAIAGDDEPIAIIDRPVLHQLREEPDVGRFLDLYAALVTDVSGRLAPLVSVVEHAAQTHPDIAELWRGMGENRLFGARHVAGLLAEKTTAVDLDVEQVADVLFLYNDPRVHQTLVGERGWTSEAFRTWLARTYRDALAGAGRP